MNKILLIALAALFMGAAGVCMAQTGSDAAGAAELHLLEKIFTGSIGFTLGLVVMVLGIFALINGNMGGALILGVLGVLITLLPGVYNGVRTIVCPIASSLGGQCGGPATDGGQ